MAWLCPPAKHNRYGRETLWSFAVVGVSCTLLVDRRDNVGNIVVPEMGDIPATADVVIIGGGILGVATAFHASKAGLQTEVVEMREGLATLTTVAVEECFRAKFTEPEYVAVMKASIAVFQDLAEVVGLAGYVLNPHHRVFKCISWYYVSTSCYIPWVCTSHFPNFSSF